VNRLAWARTINLAAATSPDKLLMHTNLKFPADVLLRETGISERFVAIIQTTQKRMDT